MSFRAFCESRQGRLLGAVGGLAFLLLAGLEIATDDEPIQSFDLLGDVLEMAILVATAVTAGVVASRMQGQQEERLGLIRDLAQARAEGETWRRQAHAHVIGLGMAIDAQFERWGLTAAEREIGLLMLKGFSHKEVAELRSTTDATVRHQAKTVYQKAGVPNRAAFCAFFLEDLLPGNPEQAEASAGTSSATVSSSSGGRS